MSQSKTRRRQQPANRFDRERWAQKLDSIIRSEPFHRPFFNPDIHLDCGNCGRTLANGYLNDDYGVGWDRSSGGGEGRQRAIPIVPEPGRQRRGKPDTPYRPRDWSIRDDTHMHPESCHGGQLVHEPQRAWSCHRECGARYTVPVLRELRAVARLIETTEPPDQITLGQARVRRPTLRLILGVDVG